MGRLKAAAVATLGKLLAIVVFTATSLASCGGAFYAGSAVLFPEQTEFAGGPPQDFMVVQERPGAPEGERFRAVYWRHLAQNAGKDGGLFRVSAKKYSSTEGDPWSFKVLEETAKFQVIQLDHFNSHSIRTRYRVEDGRITPLSYKTDGGVGLAMLLLPVFLGSLWLGFMASRAATRWLGAVIRRTGGE